MLKLPMALSVPLMTGGRLFVTVRVTLVVYALSAPAASYALTRYCTLVHP